MASEPDGNRTVEKEDKTMIDRRNQSGGTVFVRIQTRRKLNYSETCSLGSADSFRSKRCTRYLLTNGV